MYIVSIAFPNAPGATFDHDYYRHTHLPMLGAAMKDYGLGYATVMRGEQGLDGGPPATILTTILSFRTEKGAHDAMASDGAGALMAALPKFTSVTPLIQFNSAVV